MQDKIFHLHTGTVPIPYFYSRYMEIFMCMFAAHTNLWRQNQRNATCLHKKCNVSASLQIQCDAMWLVPSQEIRKIRFLNGIFKRISRRDKIIQLKSENHTHSNSYSLIKISFSTKLRTQHRTRGTVNVSMHCEDVNERIVTTLREHIYKCPLFDACR